MIEGTIFLHEDDDVLDIHDGAGGAWCAGMARALRMLMGTMVALAAVAAMRRKSRRVFFNAASLEGYYCRTVKSE